MARSRYDSVTGRSAFARVVFGVLLFFASAVVGLLLSEIALRIFPIPGIEFDVATYDGLTGSGLYPNSTYLYRNRRGDTATRRINSIGYLDTEHLAGKRDGSKRIGFFGDSYTAARHVELNETFFRKIENRLEDSNVETLAFGVSGFSTLQSYLTHKKWSQYFDIDLVVYVFVENDPGDNVPELKDNPWIPYPVLTKDGFVVDDSFRALSKNRNSLPYKIGDYLTSKSLVLSTISERLGLLLQHGVDFEVTEEDRWMATSPDVASDEEWKPSSDDLPSTWSDELRERAMRVTGAIILQWSQEVENQSRDFAILYVPRAREMNKKAEQQDSWKYWLQTFCTEHDITFFDPSLELREAQLRGREVFYDHFTKQGHEAVAESFVKGFRQNYQQWTMKN